MGLLAYLTALLDQPLNDLACVQLFMSIVGENVLAALNHPKLTRDQRPGSAAQLQLSNGRFLEFVEDPG